MNWLRAAVVLVAIPAAACGGGSTPHTVRTHGTLVRVGGPAPGGPVAMPGVRLHVQGEGGSADVRTDRHGRFAFDVVPGTYTVSITTGGLAPVTVPHVVHVPHTGRLRLVVNIK
jgi:hypothetical protein